MSRLRTHLLAPSFRLRPRAVVRLKSLAELAWMSSVFVLVFLAIGLLEWALPSPPSHLGVRWVGHQFTWLSPALNPAPPLVQTVSLPDGWKARGLPMIGMGRYISTLEIDPGTSLDSENPWALRVDRLCSEHRIRLNGQMLVTTYPERHTPGNMEAHLIDVPTYLLHAGRNEFMIDVSCVIQGGLSALVLAPKADLKTDFLLKQQVTVSLPLAMNIACLAFAFYLITLWWLRSDDASIGLFGLATVVWSLRNCSYYLSVDPGWSIGTSSWIQFNTHVLVVALFGFFTLTFTRTALPWFKRLLSLQMVLYPIIATLALPWDPHLTFVRGTLQAVLVLSGVISLWVIVRFAGKTRLRSVLGFGLGTLAMLLTATHDFVMVRLLGDPTHAFWVPFGFPMVLPGLYMLLAERFADAIAQVEQINLTLEERVAERTADLTQANAAKSQFLAAASHDLRQPMVAISLTTGLLKERLRDPDTSAMVSRLSEAVGSMEVLLSRLLDLSRMEAGAVEVNPQRVALQPLLSTIIATEFETARLKHVRIHLHPTQAAVWTDPVLLDQILRNLIGNAVRYTESGGVVVGARRRGSRWLIQVWDSGIGIDEADHKRIFEDFVQLRTPGHQGQQGLGLGLGLALVQRAAKLLHTEVNVRSRRGRGSCFSIALPMAAVPRALPNLPGDDTIDIPDKPLSGRKILLLEDDRAVRMALERRLNAWGAFVIPLASLSDLEDALQRVHAPDLLLTDFSLGDGDGLQALREAQAAWPGLGTVIITGDTSPQRLQALADCGVPVLHKPFKVDDLVRTLMRQIAARSVPLNSN
jgi:signal transduction histidine kinase/CheY-like chemotaxis protein